MPPIRLPSGPWQFAQIDAKLRWPSSMSNAVACCADATRVAASEASAETAKVAMWRCTLRALRTRAFERVRMVAIPAPAGKSAPDGPMRRRRPYGSTPAHRATKRSLRAGRAEAPYAEHAERDEQREHDELRDRERRLLLRRRERAGELDLLKGLYDRDEAVEIQRDRRR